MCCGAGMLSLEAQMFQAYTSPYSILITKFLSQSISYPNFMILGEKSVVVETLCTFSVLLSLFHVSVGWFYSILLLFLLPAASAWFCIYFCLSTVCRWWWYRSSWQQTWLPVIFLFLFLPPPPLHVACWVFFSCYVSLLLLLSTHQCSILLIVLFSTMTLYTYSTNPLQSSIPHLHIIITSDVPFSITISL